MLGEASSFESAVDPEPPDEDSNVYLASCAAVTAANLIALRPLMARPPGTAFLGTSASVVPARIGSMLANPRKIIIDSGSDITLISADTFNGLESKPKLKTGQKINLVQITGKATINGFIQTIIYFDTDKGPVAMPIEAYVVKGMNADFILGNDFADQYRLSIIRNETGTRLELGDSGYRSYET